MPISPANMYEYLLRNDFCAFLHRSFLEIDQSEF